MDNQNEKIKNVVTLDDIASHMLDRMGRMPCDADSIIRKNEKKIVKVIEEYAKLVHQEDHTKTDKEKWRVSNNAQ